MLREKESEKMSNMKIWVTKYALTKGILEADDGEICEIVPKGMIRSKCLGGGHTYFHKPDWHESKEEADEQAEKMRLKKLESLKKQIKKLESLNFK